MNITSSFSKILSDGISSIIGNEKDKFLKEIEQESARLYAIAKEHKWGPPRNPENYILLKREYSFGRKKNRESGALKKR